MATNVLGEFIGVFSVFLVCVLAAVSLLLSRHCRSRGSLSPEEEDEGSGRAVLVTGCDSGFGHHLARRLDDQGFTVFAGCLLPEDHGAQSLARESSSRLRVVKLDVTIDDDIEQAKEVIQHSLPEKGLWAVVNNAGISDWAETEWSTIDHYSHMIDVNLLGCIRTTIAFLPLVRASKGRIVYVSSIFAFFNCLNMGAYSVSKRGLEAFADCLRVEMASFGVKVSIIQPGNFGQATNILKMKTSWEIWETLDKECKQIFNREYIELANEYFLSMSRSGLTDVNLVIDAMYHAITSPWPKYRYLLVSRLDMFFFGFYHLLPTFVTDAIFTLSPMYGKRKKMLYLKQ
ncbi:D-beta-hydroxybutyrate dehydrogenase, mitochondrial [Merluccius polli]|uniref:D-beta-hydroxybutyrate dehydrogenase, mitochondrial n=1 Tax=Merluccius polli TaxID=89951 RepID=A0AA47MIZ1_MERPO|nr:D-beta-hydroxybutyrate dehydrogenase, mitochondrial [Merluccius polli]